MPLFRQDGTIVLRAFDVAKYIVDKMGSIGIWKLQKLVYYCQAWSLVWLERPMFADRIEAWANGPVCPALNTILKGHYEVDGNTPIWKGTYIYDSSVSPDDYEAIEVVIKDYGDKPIMWLRDLTQLEKPWNDAREGVPYMDDCNNEITNEMMRSYYGSL